MKINCIQRRVEPIEIPQELIDQLEGNNYSPQKQITFGYHWKVKDLYKKGKLPMVKYDAGGNRLSVKNVSIDHYVPFSKGGKTEDANLMLATKEFNQRRGDKPLEWFTTPANVYRYLEQFVGVVVDGFNGNKYVKSLLKTLERNSDV